MDIKDLRNLIKMVISTDISEFKWEQGEERILIRRNQGVAGAPVAAPGQAVAPAVPVAPAAPVAAPAQPAESAAAATADKAEEGYETIESPIVGTFYRAPSPDSEPYAEVGTVLEKGQTLCIVEAMKLMNEIEAEFKCKIVKILKENAQPVEYGDPLFLVEPL